MKFNWRILKSQRSFSRASLLCGLLLISAATARAQSFFYSTVAGFAGNQDADGTGATALFSKPDGAALDGSGNVYISDFGNNTIRKITPQGQVTTIAGSSGIAGSMNGTGTNALFNGPQGIAVDSGNNVYVADSGNNTIRMISPAGVVSLLAGLPGVAGSANGTGTNALFNAPAGLAVDGVSNVYVADYGNHTIRKIAPGGNVSTLAGSAGNFGSANANGTNAQFYQPQGVAVDALGNVYVADTANDLIRVINTSGAVSTLAGSSGNFGSSDAAGTNAFFNAPVGITVDSFGNVYVSDTGNNLIREISPQGVVSTSAGSAGLAGSRDGNGTNALFWGPMGIALDTANNLYVADYFNGTIRKITPGAAVSTIAGSASNGSGDGAGAGARFSLPQGVAVDNTGNAYVADAANSTIRKITPAGAVSTFAGQAGNHGTNDGIGTSARFCGPQAVAVDSAGNVYVADTANDTIRKISSSGIVATLAGQAGNSNNADGTGSGAQFSGPQGIAVDAAGNVYVADTFNYTIRTITPGGVVNTLAGTPGSYGSADSTNGNALFNWPKGLALDNATNLYVADFLNHTIRQVTPSGTVTTIAGLAGVWGSADGTNSNARFFEPEAVAVDGSGNIFVADSGNQTIRKITPVGTNWVVATVGGQADISGSANGAAAGALFYYPAGIALNGGSNIVVADSGNNTIRLASVAFVSPISNLTVQARPTSAIITWTTATPSTSQIAYGLATNYGQLSQSNSAMVTQHAVLLTGLLTNQVYNFQAISTFGPAQATATGTFSTDISIILEATQATYSGVWINDTTAPDRFSPVYKYASVAPAAPPATAIFDPTIITPGQYDVYLWYSEGANRSLIAPVTANFRGGSVSVSFNETVNGGSWQLIAGNESYQAGTNAYVRLGNSTGETNKIVIADAVKWSYTPGQDLPVSGNVPGWWANFYYGVPVINPRALAANGYTILSDYILGFSPTDPNARLNFNLHATTGGGFQAVFSPWMGGRIYQLQSTSDLTSGVWQTLTNLAVTSITNGQATIAGTNANGTIPTFYRLSVQLAP